MKIKIIFKSIWLFTQQEVHQQYKMVGSKIRNDADILRKHIKIKIKDSKINELEKLYLIKKNN